MKYLIAQTLKLLFILCALIGSVVLGLILVLAYGLSQLPDVKILNGCLTTSMYQIELCPTAKNYVSLQDLPESSIQAFLISEDIQFYDHHGFQWDEVLRSVEENIETGKFKRGGSTISQQLVKNVFLTPDKSVKRKLMEAYLTWRLEDTFTKDVILERYLNVVEFGEDLYGIEKASRYYFNQSAKKLKFEQAAFLAMLLPNPKTYNSSFKQGQLTEFARSRISDILSKAEAFKRVPESDLEAAKQRFNQVLDQDGSGFFQTNEAQDWILEQTEQTEPPN